MVTTTTSTELAHFLKIVADPTRLSILNLLMEGIQCNCHLRDKLGLPMNLISHHLKILREVGLIHAERNVTDARWVYYSVDKEQLTEYYNQFLIFLNPERIQLGLALCEQE